MIGPFVWVPLAIFAGGPILGISSVGVPILITDIKKKFFS